MPIDEFDYDYHEDPMEFTNLAEHTEHQETRRELAALLAKNQAKANSK